MARGVGSAMNRDSIAASARGIGTVLTGAAILYALGRYVGWWAVAALVVYAVGDTAWAVVQLLRGGRP